MKYIFLVLILVLEMFGVVIKAPVIRVNDYETAVIIKVDKIDIGVSGFVVHEIAPGHTVILKNAVVTDYHEESQIAKVELSRYDALKNSALPSGEWKVKAGDTVVLAFGYTRGLLIAPTEEIYYKITKSSTLQWVHPDIFATILSFNGHPTPLRSDFTQMSNSSSVGLVFIYLDNLLYTLDAKSFKILATTEAKLDQGEAHLPFYTRVPKIKASWWGKGSQEIEDYERYYYELLADANFENKKLYETIKNGDKKLQYILDEFYIKE